jgi:tetratricopeptide (TPR) repeat protein
MLHTKNGSWEDARGFLDRGLAIARRRGDSLVEDVIILNLAELWVRADQLERAEELCVRSLTNAKRRGDRLTAAEALTCRARIERRRGQYDKGLATLRIANFEADGSGDRMLFAEIQRELGEIARSRGDASAARQALTHAAEEFRMVGAMHDATQVESSLAEMGAA